MRLAVPDGAPGQKESGYKVGKPDQRGIALTCNADNGGPGAGCGGLPVEPSQRDVS